MIRRGPLLFIVFLTFGFLTGICQSNAMCFADVDGNTIKYRDLFINLYDCEFVDHQNGWLCGKGGKIYRTKDGGNTWNGQNSGTDESLFDISVSAAPLKAEWVSADS